MKNKYGRASQLASKAQLNAVARKMKAAYGKFGKTTLKKVQK